VNRPEIVAHRGASRERPENTVSAFRRAVELGADGIELDVHLSADGALMVHHDAVPGAVPSPEFLGRGIHSLTLKELETFRVGGEPIPTLTDVLDAVGPAAIIYCELKGPLTAAPAATVLLARAASRSAVHSFDHRQVAEARRHAPSLPRGVLETSYHLDPVASMASVDARDLWQFWETIDQALVDAVHARNGRVIAWTVNEKGLVSRLANMGVDAVCTDDVALARDALSAGG
jgi:glycerophosphoryl diester phosphodiesterase